MTELSFERPVSSITPASVSDLEAVVSIVARAYAKYVARIGKPPGPMLDDYGEHVRHHRAWVARRERAAVGVLVLTAEQDCLLLDNVAVDPAFQGHGIGRELMRFAEAEAVRRGYGELRLYTHQAMTENVAMYAAGGWEETGRGEQAGYERVFFRKVLG